MVRAKVRWYDALKCDGVLYKEETLKFDGLTRPKCDGLPYKEETLKCDGLIRQSAMAAPKSIIR